MSMVAQNVADNKKSGHPFFFPQGLPGLEDFYDFYVEPMPDNRLFCLLQAVENEEVGIIMVDPFPFFPDYSVDLLETDRRQLRLKQEKDMVIFTTVTLEGDKLYTNLAAPILINVAQRRGKQMIVPHRCDDMRVPLDTVAGPEN